MNRNHSKGPRVFHDDTDRGPKFPTRQGELVHLRGGIEYHRLDVQSRVREGRWPSRALLHLKQIAVDDTPDRTPSFHTDGDCGAHDYFLALAPEPHRRPRVVGALVLDLRPGWTCSYDFGQRKVTGPAVPAPDDSARVEFLWVPSSRRRTGIATALVRTACPAGQRLLLHRSFTQISTGFARAVCGPLVGIYHREAAQVEHPRSPYLDEPRGQTMPARS